MKTLKNTFIIKKHGDKYNHFPHSQLVMVSKNAGDMSDNQEELMHQDLRVVKIFPVPDMSTDTEELLSEILQNLMIDYLF